MFDNLSRKRKFFAMHPSRSESFRMLFDVPIHQPNAVSDGIPPEAVVWVVRLLSRRAC